MKNTTKKGFTIVELVIVIAVIAILAAVLIPTFSNLINKANTSSDKQLVKNLNTMLASEEPINGRANTMYEALQVARSNGYIVEKLTPTNANNHILWDQTHNRFVLKEGDVITFADESVASIDTVEKQQPHTLWEITNDPTVFDTETVYSYYIGTNFTGTAITTNTSIDVGENTTITSILYTRTSETESREDVIIRTNDELTNIEINAPADTVIHYGTVGHVIITAVAGDSYHERGFVVGNLSVKEGRIVVEEQATVPVVVITSTSEDEIAKVEIKTEDTPIITTTETSQAFVKAENIIATTGVTIDVEVVADSALDNASKFAGGLGTKANPYLVANVEQWKNMAVSKDSFRISVIYYRLLNDIDASNENLYTTYGSAHIDGNNFSLTVNSDKTTSSSGDEKLYLHFYGSIENLKIVQVGTDVVKISHVAYSATFKNIIVSSGRGENFVHTSKYGGSFVHQTSGGISFENCTSNINMTVATDKYAGVFVRNYISGNGAVAKFINCANNGKISGSNIGFFTGNDSQASQNMTWLEEKNGTNGTNANAAIYVESCMNNGVLMGTVCCEPFGWVNSATSNAEINEMVSNSDQFYKGIMITNDINDMGLSVTDNGKLKIIGSNRATVEKYILTYTVSTSFSKDGVRTATSYFTITKEIATADIETLELDYITKVVLDINYDKMADVSYADIESVENVNERGYRYKVIQLNGDVIVIVNAQSMLDDRVDGANEVICNETPKYLLTAQNLNNVSIGAVQYTVEELKTQQ